MKLNINLIRAVVLSILINLPVLAEQELTGEEIKSVFSNKTFTMQNHLKEKSGTHFAGSDGEYIKKNKKGKIKKQKWYVDKHGRFCKQGNKRLHCGQIVEMGNGEYHWIMNDEHTHTMSNFIEGNQL